MTTGAIAEAAGYRLVRRIGAGSRAIVHLGHPGGLGASPVAVKLYRGGVPAADIHREIGALVRAAGDHVVRVLDVGSADDDRPVLVLERLAGPTLGGLLADRGVVELGEAVTILAPLASTVARMHATGITHGGLSPGSVRFDDRGAPVLVGFGRARVSAVRGSAIEREADPLVMADLRSLAQLASTVLGHSALELSRREAMTKRIDADFAVRLEQLLFELAAPTAVAVGRAPLDELPPPRSVHDTPAGWRREDGLVERLEPIESAEPAEPAVHAALAPDWLRPALDSARARIAAALGAVRRPVWSAAAAAIALLVAAVVVTTPGARPAAPEPPVDPIAVDSAGPAAVDPADEPHRPEAPEAPEAAAAALLDVRLECYRELSAVCLERAVHVGSPLHGSDTAAILAGRDSGRLGEPFPREVDIVTEIERIGDSAIVALEAGDRVVGTALLIRTPDGWRLRDLTERQPGGSE